MLVPRLLLVVVCAAAYSVYSPEVVEAADYALIRLTSLSESGVYRSLSLHRIASARSEKGIFHDNIFLTLELASPHFESGEPVEAFEVIVMTDKDGVRNVAIDSFPDMAQQAVETFQIEAIERRRRARKELLAQIEKEAADDLIQPTNSELLLAELEDAAVYQDARRRASEILLRYTS